MATELVAPGRRSDLGALIRSGAVGGVGAGIVFAMFEMITALVLDGPDAFFMPLRMIGGIGFGPSAVDPATSLLSAGGAGIVIHMILSMMYGIVVAGVLSLVPRLSTSRSAVLISASIAGVVLWLVNFYGLAPVFGWTWFPDKTNAVVQFVAHTFFFGTVLGFVLDRAYFQRGVS
jgi:hypothetical protein